MIDRLPIVKEIGNRIAEMIPEVDVSQLAEDSVLRDFASFDSLQILEMLVWLEERFDISIPDEELVADRFDSIGKMVDYVVEHQA